MITVEGFDVVPTLLSIGVVLAVLAGTLMVLRWITSMRFGGSTRPRDTGTSLSIVERHPMGRNGALIVMRYGGREHVLGVTESSITPIAEGTIDLREQVAESDLDGDHSGRVARVIDVLREKTVRH